MENTKKYTLITGGSEGIGLSIAKLFAKDKHDLIIVARNLSRLRNVKDELEKSYGIKVEILSLDLSNPQNCENIFKFVEEKNLFVDNLVNNAGVGCFGYFNDFDENLSENLININITSLTIITKYFLKEMIKKGSGGILNVSSTAAFCAGPKMSLYYASKAYVMSLTEALHEECRDSKVKVCCLCPGPVRTSFQNKSGIKKSESAKKYLMSPEEVAREGYVGFKKGKAIIVPGFKNKIIVTLSKFIPRSISRKVILKNNV